MSLSFKGEETTSKKKETKKYIYRFVVGFKGAYRERFPGPIKTTT